MTSKLNLLCEFVKEKIAISLLNRERYISTENMLPNKQGITRASSLPAVAQVQAYQKGDVLISNIRPYFKKIWFATDSGGCSNDVLVFRAHDNCIPEFLYYLLSNDSFFEYATLTSKGTKMPRGDKKAIMNYEVPVFDKTKQRRIVSLVTCLDKKIFLNNRINDNLVA